MDILYFSQTLFYLTFSLLLIVVGVMGIYIVYNIFILVRNLKKISDNVEHASSEIKDNIMEIFDRLSHFPFLSMFMHKKPVKKGRKKKTTK